MPFGLTNAPASFQCLMNHVFRGMLCKFVLVFFDDILVYSSSWLLHLEHLHIVLETLQQERLFAKASKCLFGTTSIDYLGHHISAAGVEMDPSKVLAVIDWPQPTSLTQLKGFLGLTGYYRKFVKGYASIAAPLTDLTKKDAFRWTTTTDQAFNDLKRALTSAPILRLPNFSVPFVLETNASGLGISVVLMQDGHPIAYFSQKLSSRMHKQSAYVRELFAVTQAMAKFRHYLLGHRFIIRTDHRSLKELLSQPLHTPEQQQWLPKFLGYDFEVQYRPDKENLAADALSRSMFVALSTAEPSWLLQVQQSLQADPHWQNILTTTRTSSSGSTPFTCYNGLLYWKNRLVIP